MDHDLLAVGSWIDDSAANQLLTMRLQERRSVRHYSSSVVQTDRHGCCLNEAEHIEVGRESRHSQLSRSKDELLDVTPREAICEIRAVQMVKAEGRQQGN